MRAEVIHLFPKKTRFSSPHVATVQEAVADEAVSVWLDDEQISLPVIAHLSEVPPLQEGDSVLVARSEEGVLVQGRLRREGEKPTRALVEEDEDGKLRFEAAGGICLQVGESRIEILADGRIRIDGEEVCTTAAGRVKLRGGSIELG